MLFRFNIYGNLFNRPRTSCDTLSAADLVFADDAVLIRPFREAVHGLEYDVRLK